VVQGSPWGRDPFIEALLICLNVGLFWMLGLTMILVRREQGSLAWSHVRDALWLRAPRDPKTRRVGRKVCLWVLPFIVLTAVVNAGLIDPEGPLPMADAGASLTSPTVRRDRSCPAAAA
jgi:hypothetical protein